MIRSILFTVISLVMAGSPVWVDTEPTPAPISAFRITGVVVNSVDETPVAHAHLNATVTTERAGRQFFPRAGLSNGIETDTDEHGRFVLTVPSAGKWRLTASATGFVSQAYEEHHGFSSAVVLTSTKPTIDLHFRLPPEAEIAGTVFDDAGEAVRDARVTLQLRAASTPNREQQTFRNRATVQTDDRGVFEFAGLAMGDYRILVDAKPWYSTANQPRVPSNTIATDSKLDVTYQLTWYPGADDPTQAETLSLHPADSRRADFHLVPIPAVHLQLNVPASSDPASGRPLPFYPVLERVDIGENSPGFSQSALIRGGSRGQVDIGGLAPGLYRMRLPGPDRGAETKLIEIAPGTSRVVDAVAVSVETANVMVEVDNGSEERPLGIELRNTESGRRFTPGDTNMFMPGRSGRESQPKVQQKLSLQVPPGRYEVATTNRDVSLIKISAKGAEVSGRFLTVHAGDTILNLYTARGHATVNGVATANGKPVEGAMVLLVPAGLDDPSSFTRLVQDQTNTDGSFDLNDIVPGQYILIAIDHGWTINWSDATTLQRYLTQGIPLDLHADAIGRQDVPVQAP